MEKEKQRTDQEIKETWFSETMKQEQVFLLDSLRRAAERGHLARTYAHLAKELKRVGVFDENISVAFEKFLPQVEQAIDCTAQLRIVKDFIGPYIRTINIRD